MCELSESVLSSKKKIEFFIQDSLSETSIVFQFLQRPLTTDIAPQQIYEIKDWFSIDEVRLKL
ncbi:hypothetical protein PR048_005631 [Dryococelus australis]|uniref:Uncharacterized protein n=1 Tax=Dryococelus australis TaxID=614101 RepID=A0ABQ9I9Y3_9NEOP|nr:hypothetical protein PR048_005631 [Dryococelus australis]